MSHHGQHDKDCFGCKVKSIQISPSATPTRRNKIPPKVNRDSNAWERGIVRDSRNMPLLDKHLEPVGTKEYVHDRHKHEEGRRKLLHQASNPSD